MDIYTTNAYIRDTFGEKLYKISLNAGTTCPNRDGKAGTGGCIFCSASGSGDFSEDAVMSIDEQIELAKKMSTLCAKSFWRLQEGMTLRLYR